MMFLKTKIAANIWKRHRCFRPKVVYLMVGLVERRWVWVGYRINKALRRWLRLFKQSLAASRAVVSTNDGGRNAA